MSTSTLSTSTSTSAPSSTLTTPSLPPPWYRLTPFYNKVPAEIQSSIVKFSGPFTWFINGTLTEDEIKKYKDAIWIEALSINWEGDLTLLPPDPIIIYDELAIVTSRTLYENLGALKPEWKDLDEIQNDFKDATKWKWSEFESDDFHLAAQQDLFFQNVLYKLQQRLIQIPLRNLWMEEIPDWMKQDKQKLFCLAACFNHYKLLQMMLVELQDDPQLACISGICLTMIASRGFMEVMRLLLSVD
ncbi:hypothetical protein HDU76_010056, partial [Blyttiomyces sp. JEL0837]